VGWDAFVSGQPAGLEKTGHGWVTADEMEERCEWWEGQIVETLSESQVGSKRVEVGVKKTGLFGDARPQTGQETAARALHGEEEKLVGVVWAV
jgi:hypothetical protein